MPKMHLAFGIITIITLLIVAGIAVIKGNKVTAPAIRKLWLWESESSCC